MGALWDLVQAYKDTQPWEITDSQIARKVGATKSAASRWRDMKQLPRPDYVRGLARVINQPYRRVLDAAMLDAGYLLPAEVEGEWRLSPVDVVTLLEQDERVHALLEGPGSGKDRARVVGDLVRGRLGL